MTNTPAWDGRPLIRPEVDGEHVLQTCDIPGVAAWNWRSDIDAWERPGVRARISRSTMSEYYGQYISAVLTPADLAAMLAAEREAGRAEEREACAAVCDMHRSGQEYLANSRDVDVCLRANAIQDECEEMAAAIRARGGKS